MAIDTQCPACTKSYRLKDELAGKRVTCGNPTCRKQFVVPVSSANGPVAPKPSPKPAEAEVDAEALAAIAFAEEGDAAPVDQRKIAMVCAVCDEKWTEPWDRQGKNVLCPECKNRMKVPIPKSGKVDWRDPKAGRPSLARQEELEGVVSASDTSHVSGETLRKTGVIQDNIEPRPTWHYIAAVVVPLVLLGGVVYGGLLVFRSKADSNRDDHLTAALTEMLTETGETLPPGEVPLFKGALQIAAGEYLIRSATDRDRRDEARETLAKARTDLDSAPAGGGRDVLLSELAQTQVLLGGGPTEVENGTRIRWVPAPAGAIRAKINEAEHNLQGELRSTLSVMRKDDKPSAFEVRLRTVRRLAFELAQRGQPEVVPSLLAATFLDAEQAEAEAWIMVETARAGHGDKEAAGKALITGLRAPSKVSPDESVSDAARMAHTAILLLNGNATEALALAKRPGGEPEGRAKALALVAEWTDGVVAAEAVRDAVALVSGIGPKAARPSDYTLVRLAQAAGRTGQPEAIEPFAKLINKDDYKAWARGEGLRQALAHEGTKVAEEQRAEIPDNPKDQHVGQAWGRLAIARHNAKATGTKDGLRDFDRWGRGTYRPFGLAGLALGLQDREGQ